MKISMDKATARGIVSYMAGASIDMSPDLKKIFLEEIVTHWLKGMSGEGYKHCLDHYFIKRLAQLANNFIVLGVELEREGYMKDD